MKKLCKDNSRNWNEQLLVDEMIYALKTNTLQSIPGISLCGPLYGVSPLSVSQDPPADDGP